MPNRQIANTLANFFGAGAGIVLPLIFNISYFRLLESESYGLVTFFTSLQLVMYLLDMGLSQTMVRELARRASDSARSGDIRTALFTLQFVFCAIGLIFGAIIFGSAKWLSTHWLNISQLSFGQVEVAIKMMGAMLAVMFFGTGYGAALRGLQHQVLANVFLVVSGGCRGAITIICLITLGATSNIFFSAQLVLVILEVAILAFISWTILPPSPQPTLFDSRFLRTIWRFSSANGLSVLIGQLMMMADKVILSALLPLDVFGRYGLSVAAAAAIQRLAAPVSTAYFPHFVELVESRQRARLLDSYQLASQLAATIIIPAGVLIAIYAKPIMLLLTKDPDTASQFGPVLSLLAIGNTVNALMWLPHSLQLANGAAWIALRINICQSIFYLPLIFLLLPVIGVFAPVGLWLAVNVLSLPVFIYLTHQVALPGQGWPWFRNAILAPSCAATLVLAISYLVGPATVTWIVTSVWMSLSGLIGLLAALLSAPKARQFVRQSAANYLKSF